MGKHIVRGMNNSSSPDSEWGFDDELVELFNQLNREIFTNKLFSNKISNSALPLPKALYYKELMPKSNSSTSGGKFWSKSTEYDNSRARILISYEYRVIYGVETVKNILLHEMVHWWCYYNRLPYDDNDKEFIFWLGWFHGSINCAAYKGAGITKQMVEEKATSDLLKSLFNK
jgi:hypothetical protein